VLLVGCGSTAVEEVTETPAGAFEASLATFADGFAVAWYDTRDGHAEIYERALDAAGRPAGPERRLTKGKSAAYEADIQALGGDGFVIGWYEKTSDARLTPHLGAWTRDGRVRWTKALSTRGRNTVARVHGRLVFAAWIEDDGVDRSSVWAGWWNDDGTERLAPRRVADAGRTTWNLNAAIDVTSTSDAPRAVLVFDAATDTHSEELFVVDVAEKDPRPRRLTADDGQASKYPDVALSGDRVALTWFDSKDGNEEVYAYVGDRRTLTDGGDLAGTRITTTPGHSTGAYLAWNGDRVGLAWSDDSEGQHEVYFEALDAGGRPAAPARRLTRTSAASLIPAIHPWRKGFALAWSEYDRGGEDAHEAEGRSQIAVSVVP
jgi:hypothetical protein